MRKIDSGLKALPAISSRSRALSRSWPKGFSMTTLLQWEESWPVMPWRLSWLTTDSKDFGGIDR